MNKIIIALSAIALLGACAGDNRQLAAGGNLAQANVLLANSNFTAALGAARVSAQPTFPGTSSIPSLAQGRAIWDNCKTFVVGSATTDAHYKIKYDCNKVSDGFGGTKSLVGTYEVEYLDENKKDIEGGYSVTYDLKQNTYPANGEPGEDTFKGYAKGKTTDTQIITEHDVEFHVIGKDAFVLDWGFRNTLKMTVTPESMANVYSKGTIEFAGFYKLTGLLGGDMSGNMIPEINVTYEISSKDLTYDQACTTYYKSGTITLKDAQNTIVLEYACTTATAYYNNVGFGWTF